MNATGGSPRIAVLHAPGSNRDGEAALAVEIAGGAPEIVLLQEVDRLHDFAAVIVPGGFSYGDALGAGTRMAFELGDRLKSFSASGRSILGICNGFQVLVKSGLLPGSEGPRRVTLAHNASGRFVCRWVHLTVEPNANAAIADFLPPVVTCPVAHGEGRIAVTDPAVVAELEAEGRILFRYATPDGTRADGSEPFNPNGSVGDIAGLCDSTGTVWGLMPHPEDHLFTQQHPRRDASAGVGLGLFQALVDRARAS